MFALILCLVIFSRDGFAEPCAGIQSTLESILGRAGAPERKKVGIAWQKFRKIKNKNEQHYRKLAEEIISISDRKQTSTLFRAYRGGWASVWDSHLEKELKIRLLAIDLISKGTPLSAISERRVIAKIKKAFDVLFKVQNVGVVTSTGSFLGAPAILFVPDKKLLAISSHDVAQYMVHGDSVWPDLVKKYRIDAKNDLLRRWYSKTVSKLTLLYLAAVTIDLKKALDAKKQPIVNDLEAQLDEFEVEQQEIKRARIEAWIEYWETSHNQKLDPETNVEYQAYLKNLE